ncbi:fatty-acyl-CoA synthase [Saccharopolyspora erythraea NRRL 2338]|uniref:Fatty acid:CoA ligase n=2 Tax=Saccharopolyspora erythraea TaxID=1836 RepID=A4FPZ7_SACEN|nr:long-chain fatty acid--CoA ligase [Saccharopolyspora erythraea]PFG99767.1 fatty-acyl-CoA synthase [Saccharopolyspora erythraea NRRL 2338]QRK94023.1 long-chain fatty acid--CoA ligase [Saccharopolyspora erythraea]CAM06122.1 putative fatty acid:CoA ligase [Saccharopolyspora erythraea NRRL 2338]
MFSTMQDGTLTTARILAQGSGPHGTAEVVTWTGDGARRSDYAEVGRRVARLANALRALGVTGDQRVGTFMWNNAEHLEAYFAVPSMGAVLHTLNIRLFPEQIVYVADHAEDRVVIVDSTLLPLFAKILPQLGTVRHVVVVGGGSLEAPEGVEVHDYEALLAAQPDEFDWPELDERSAAAMCYTSGTTGNPKGVVYSHRSIYLHSMQVCMTDGMALSQADRALAVVPMFHAMSWGLPYAAFLVGSSLIMPDRFLQPEPLTHMIAAERPTFAAAVPTIWQGVLQHLEQDPQDMSSLREVVVGGSACPPSLMRAFHDRYGIPVLHAWGMTETSPLGSVARPPAGATGDELWAYRSSQGRVPAGVEARLVGDDGSVLPWDGSSVGELEVRGPWIAGAYYQEDDPEKFHDGWLRTGDVGHISPDGFLRLTDRAKDVIKSGGEWISSVELENHVMSHPAVAEAVVIGVPDEKWDERPLVAVVLREGQRATAEELSEFLAGRVAKWQLPEHWTFVAETPKTSVGKFDKKRLRQQHSQGELDVQTLG